ncbi:CRISPR-associated endonuclease Cas1 [Halolactibacillus alkaliphilus]|uniref:CRISPR-associated endonuclease Cas1 n=1 Tax=Halolactibacillus alkaliphilus TaxID=442899 RepID=A0A511WZS4_9BACI|nr:type II CRISPR-associated endonuclease Cas1 [Halolactibacillus alkaliphilus]GEN56194.1 CRISPR-associated endonuclease Cas1 [Halolactibacillus alkaliphilus]GGN66630.1 CRISPR-associated endonuclease Cas1 [Halolactibacillus alkaliphilus]SFO68071.1 CRISPR-associated endonuclease Cas1 [Halolactibacillus alkaliphilus]
MGWRTVVVNQHSKLAYKNNALLFKTSEKQEVIHLSEIDILILETTDITLTTMLLKRLVDENILVIFCDDKRLPSAKLMPYFGRHDSSLQLSKQVVWQEEKRQVVWTEIIAQKILNQHLYLREVEHYEKSQSILNLYDGLELFDPTNREGHAARIYFQSLFDNSFSRELQTTVNAALDYGYTLLLSVFAREIVKAGCLTQIGMKHVNQFNDFNLASDIMEPFRPLVDQIVYENREKDFKLIKRQLFALFTNNYAYNFQQMYLTNIVQDYTKKIIKVLNGEAELTDIPVFKI